MATAEICFRPPLVVELRQGGESGGGKIARDRRARGGIFIFVNLIIGEFPLDHEISFAVQQ